MSIVGKVLRGTGKTIKWALLACAALIVVVIVVAIVGLGHASDKSDKSSKQVKPAQFHALKIGARASHVHALFGKPESTDSTEVGGFKQTCWYYGVLSQKGSYQFCFNGKNRLEAKSRY
jgi:outer membrane protein assembly factor BamE (lipoprotein component of BamABCDE complex)